MRDPVTPNHQLSSELRKLLFALERKGGRSAPNTVSRRRLASPRQGLETLSRSSRYLLPAAVSIPASLSKVIFCTPPLPVAPNGSHFCCGPVTQADVVPNGQGWGSVSSRACCADAFCPFPSLPRCSLLLPATFSFLLSKQRVNSYWALTATVDQILG